MAALLQPELDCEADKTNHPYPRSTIKDCQPSPYGRYTTCLILGVITLIAFFIILGVGCADGRSYSENGNCCWIATLVTGLVGSILTSVGGTGMRESVARTSTSSTRVTMRRRQAFLKPER
jgi:hypothetical protein